MKPRPWLSASIGAGLCLLCAPPARACGVSASGVSSCSLTEHDEAVRPHWVVAASGLYTSTRLRFDHELYAEQARYAALATLAYLPTAKLVLQAGLGAAFGGSLNLADGQYQFSPGPTALLGADFRPFDDGRFFLILTAALSFASARTHKSGEASEGYQAFDLRLGTQFGIQLARSFRPYVAARVFGGPIFGATKMSRSQALTLTTISSVQGLPCGSRKRSTFSPKAFPWASKRWRWALALRSEVACAASERNGRTGRRISGPPASEGQRFAFAAFWSRCWPPQSRQLRWAVSELLETSGSSWK